MRRPRARCATLAIQSHFFAELAAIAAATDALLAALLSQINSECRAALDQALRTADPAQLRAVLAAIHRRRDEMLAAARTRIIADMRAQQRSASSRQASRKPGQGG